MINPHNHEGYKTIKLFKAISHCDSIGGRIFTPKNEDENQLLIDLYIFLNIERFEGPVSFGIAVHFKEGKWIDYYTNQPPTYTNWKDNVEPKCEEDKARF